MMIGKTVVHIVSATVFIAVGIIGLGFFGGNRVIDLSRQGDDETSEQVSEILITNMVGE